MSTSFQHGHKIGKEADEAKKNRLYQEIAKLKIELNWIITVQGFVRTPLGILGLQQTYKNWKKTNVILNQL